MKKTKRVFGGAVGHGLPFEDFEAAFDAPDEVEENLAHLRPMIKAVKDMTETKGWSEYVEPFLEKQADARVLVGLIRDRKDGEAAHAAAKIEAMGSLLNFIKTLRRTAISLDAIEAKKSAQASRD